jgi:hypothetical protein
VTEPDGVVITISFAPDVPLGVVTVSEVAVFEPKVAAAPPTVTEVAPVRLAPLITVDVPPAVGPAVTDRELNVGGRAYE